MEDLYNPIGPVNICQNEFSHHEGEHIPNGAGGGLGFYHANDYPVLVDGNRFLYNSVGYGGGFNEVNCYNLKLTNNAFIGNDAQEGGAIRIYNDGSSNEYRPQIINNTFFNNSANGYGGAISYVGGVVGCSPVIMNCIFWENSAPPGGGQDIDNWSNDTVFVYYSDIDTSLIASGPWQGGFNIFADPELEEDGIHLSEGSPCINLGVNSFEMNGTTYSCPDHDIDGDPRPLNEQADIGADERLWVGIVDLGHEQDDPSIQVFPNPFTVSTDIQFSLQSTGPVELSIYDNSGKKVMVIIKDVLQSGTHQLKLQTHGLKSGIYFCTLRTNEGIQTKKIIKF